MSNTGWEHYEWWAREPHVLLFRRRRATIVDAETQCDACTPTRPHPRCAEDPEEMSQPKEPGPQQSERKRRLTSKRGAEPMPEACEQPSKIQKMALPLDERAASLGLSPKLFAWQIPEVSALCSAMDAAKARVEAMPWTCARKALFLAQSFLLYRGVRGLDGVLWLQEELGQPDALALLMKCSLGFGQGPGCGFDRRHMRSPRALASILATAHDAHVRDGAAKSWAAHSEGRHHWFSGIHFLRALQSLEGAVAWATVAQRLAVHIEFFMQCAACRQPLPDGCAEHLVSSLQGHFVLAKRAEQVTKAGPYNAMDAARVLLLWAAQSLGCDLLPLSAPSFEEIRKGQSSTSTSCFADVFACADAFEEKRKRLAAVARPLTLSPRNLKPNANAVMWPSVLVHLCEWAQTVRQLDEQSISEVCGAVAAGQVDAVQVLQNALRQKPRPGSCLTAELFTALRKKLTGLNQRSEELRAEQPAPSIGPTGRGGVQLKGFYACPICRSVVRRDGMARHQQSSKCRKRSVGEGAVVRGVLKSS